MAMGLFLICNTNRVTDGHLMTGSMIDLAFCVARKSPNERQKAGLCLRFSIFPTLLSVLTETRRLIFPEIEQKCRL